MPKRKVQYQIISYGEYTKWNRDSKELPRIIAFKTRMKADIDKEFGMILNIKGARGKSLEYRIKHPPFKDKNGHIEPDFTGVYQIPGNDFNFFIGDCIWEPIDDKIGNWTVSVKFEGKLIAEKTFLLTRE